MKKTRLVILILASILLLFSWTRVADDGCYSEEETVLYEKVTLLEDENGNRTLVHNGILYYYDELGFFSVLENPHYINDGDIMLGWTGHPFGCFYTQEYYSYTQNSPLFIYTIRGWQVYFCETYDYRLDTFVIEGTDAKILFSDAIIEEPVFFESYSSKTKVILRSETDPRVISKLRLHRINNTWYVSTGNSYYLKITNEFKQLLIENKIIEI